MSPPLPALDLVESPFTEPGSRILLTRVGDALVIGSAAYERPVDRSRLVPRLTLRSATGSPVGIEAVDAATITYSGGACLAFAGESALSLGLPRGTWVVDLRLVSKPRLSTAAGAADTDIPDQPLRWLVEGSSTVTQTAHTRDGQAIAELRIHAAPTGTRLLLAFGERDAPATAHDAAVDAARRRWRDWMTRLPPVRPDLAPTAALAWWTLRANQIRLRHDPNRLIVAPSKLGYAGAWQWDSYFIATGLRHGAPDQAWDQIALFLDHQLPDGLIPDVVSDEGILANAGDLPAGDVQTLQTHLGQAASSVETGSAAGSLPVTKPPLTAWALWNLHRTDPDLGRLAWAAPRIAASQQWWNTASDTNGDGLAEYLHPYSSGLDDSPLFDFGVPAETPDLNSYLVCQDDLLARFATTLGRSDQAAEFRHRAETRMSQLVTTRWDDVTGRFSAIGAGRTLPTFTPFHLMPLLTGRLPESIIDRLVASLVDPQKFWGHWPVPTVAFDEPTFNPDRMWRGPTWLNVNRLLVEGLMASGRPELARELAERSLSMVVAGGGLYEHWNPLTGQRAASATTCFSWSAALFVDQAVAVTV